MTTTPRHPADVLASVSLFVDLSEAEIHALAELSSRRTLEAGQVLFTEGEACEGLFAVESGAIKIFKSAPSGREQILAIETAGGIVAELPVFDGGPYPASASAFADTTLLFVSKHDFRAFCLAHPEVALKVLRAVGKRLRVLVMLIEDLSFTTVRHRLASLLLRMAKTEGRPSSRGVEIFLPTHQELAARVGTVRELVSRNLGRFQVENLIVLEGKQVVVTDMKGLEELVESE